MPALDGIVRDNFRINAQLVNAQNGFQIWSATYDRELDDIFAVQESIAESVVEALKVPLLGHVATATRSRGDNPAAYNLVLEGRYLADKQGEDDLRRAAELYEQALELDPGYALAWASLAESYSRRAAQAEERKARWMVSGRQNCGVHPLDWASSFSLSESGQACFSGD